MVVILDQDVPRFKPLVDAFQQEIRAFMRADELVLLPPRAGDGSTAGVSRVLAAALRDPSVSVVIALGGISSHLLAHSGRLPKPAIAAMVIDAQWQGLPQVDGASGVRNLAYVDQSYPALRRVDAN